MNAANAGIKISTLDGLPSWGKGRVYDNITQTIGNTPVVKPQPHRRDAGADAEVLLKLEFFNPLASVKDRIGVSLIDGLEAEGKIDPDTVLIEPTSGNTGIALAFVAAARGYRLMLAMPESMSIERRKTAGATSAPNSNSPRPKRACAAPSPVPTRWSRPTRMRSCRRPVRQPRQPGSSRPHHRRGNLVRHRRQARRYRGRASAPAAPSPARAGAQAAHPRPEDDRGGAEPRAR